MTTTNEISAIQIKSRNEKLILIFPQNYAHNFWENIFDNWFYNIARNLITFERISEGSNGFDFLFIKLKSPGKIQAQHQFAQSHFFDFRIYKGCKTSIKNKYFC